MTCAVWNGNESTFDAFMDLLKPEEVVNMTDSNGWTLLHLAAENGNRYILKALLDIGINPRALTMGSQDWMPERLKWKSLTAETIAREYGHGQLWDSVVAGKYKLLCFPSPHLGLYSGLIQQSRKSDPRQFSRRPLTQQAFPYIQKSYCGYCQDSVPVPVLYSSAIYRAQFWKRKRTQGHLNSYMVTFCTYDKCLAH